VRYATRNSKNATRKREQQQQQQQQQHGSGELRTEGLKMAVSAPDSGISSANKYPLVITAIVPIKSPPRLSRCFSFRTNSRAFNDLATMPGGLYRFLLEGAKTFLEWERVDGLKLRSSGDSGSKRVSPA